MNCETFLTFRERFIKTYISQRIKPEVVIARNNIPRMVQLQYGLTPDNPGYEQAYQRIVQYQSELWSRRIQQMLDKAHIFEIDTTEKRLMLLTTPPAKKNLFKNLHMPYPSMFLDITINPTELPTNYPFAERIEGIGLLHDETNKEIIASICSIKEGQYVIENSGIALDNFQYIYGDPERAIPQAEFIKGFVYNLLMLLNYPEVEYHHIKRTNQAKRIKAGKLPLPDSTRIILKGNIKRYAQDNLTSLTHKEFNIKFWVRGHWRHHRSGFYKEKKDTVIWISPFLKGKGDLQEKPYYVDTTKQHEQKLKKDYLFYDDIQPLDKPLRQKRENGEV